tara:strand:- start:69 stop:410 length:342 start_codon:yes stop_codon:yes gene_type:complete
MPYTLEKRKEKSRLYYLANKDKINQNNTDNYNIYRNTPEGLKKSRINNWKQYGVIHDDYSSLYEYYLNCENCEECNVELVSGNYGANKRCLDHDHITGLFRNVLCLTCNIKRK